MPARSNVEAVVLALVLSALASGCEDRARNEARMLVDRVQAIDESDPPGVRRPRVADLAALSVHDTDVVRARDACVRFHEALLTAEDAQHRARRDLERATGGDEHATKIDPDAARRISQAIRESEAAIRASRNLFSGCEGEVRGLRDRFGLARGR